MQQHVLFAKHHGIERQITNHEDFNLTLSQLFSLCRVDISPTHFDVAGSTISVRLQI